MVDRESRPLGEVSYVRRILRPLVKRFVERTSVYGLVSLARSGYLRETGWVKSFCNSSSVDASGKPVPWITYPCIHFLRERVNKELTVFEYGCGSSTFWWADKAKQVFSCEHERTWYEKVKGEIPGNVVLAHIELVTDGEYARAVTGYRGSIDIVMIDGRDRVNCAKYAVAALKEGGVIVWDNSERKEYREGFEFLEKRGFRRLDFFGLGPIANHGWQTTIFYRDHNCLGI